MKTLVDLSEESTKTPRAILRDKKLVEAIRAYVGNNLSRSSLTVEELSQALGMSRVHLYKKMLSMFGETPKEFIRSVRLEHAASLLREGGKNVSEIAYMVGFNNPKYFSKYFKTKYGLLPSVYRNSAQKLD